MKLARIELARAEIAVADDSRAKDDALSMLRSTRRELWPLLSAWRKANAKMMRAADRLLYRRMSKARRASACYWGNYNRVIADFLTARKAVRMFGRRLRMSHEARDDRGCLTVQIHRTASGVGASPAELQNGAFAALQIGYIDPAAYAGIIDDRPKLPRRRRTKAVRTTVEMRIDAAGNTMILPIWIHRPVPEGARVKRAQITWRSDGIRSRFQLALTITREKTVVVHKSKRSCQLEIGWRKAANGELIVTPDLSLSAEWMSGMDRVERLHKAIAQALVPAALVPAANEPEGMQNHVATLRVLSPVWYRLYSYWRCQLYGLRGNLLRRRREQYRLYAKRLAETYAIIRITMPVLAATAQTNRGEADNALRHRACTHALLREIQWQAKKHGATVEVASAIVIDESAAKKIRHLSKSARAKLTSARESADGMPST